MKTFYIENSSPTLEKGKFQLNDLEFLESTRVLDKRQQ